MSWNPDFWLRQEDYELLEEELKKFSVWEFNIAGKKGFVLSAGECTDSYIRLHDIIQNIHHWILNSEGEGCDNCIAWGKQLSEYDFDE